MSKKLFTLSDADFDRACSSDRYDSSGICHSCGDWFPPSEYSQPWRELHEETCYYCVQCHTEYYEEDGDSPQY